MVETGVDRARVDGLLSQALIEQDLDERARLIRKAAYWNEVTKKKASVQRGGLSGPSSRGWPGRNLRRETSG